MRIAVVTGASSGIGREFLLQLDQKETFDEIWAIARRREKLEALAAQMRAKLRAISLDLSLASSLEEYHALLATEQPEIAVLVNCAGYGKFALCEEIPLAEQLGMIDLNVRALTGITTISLPYCRPGSKIVQLDSLSAFQPVPYMTVYGASKAYVLSYSRALGAELRERRIRCMAVSPGWVRTDFFDRAMTPGNDAVTYFNRFYEAADVAKKALRDLYHTNKDVSILDLPVRLQVLAVKLLPHRLVMRIWLRQQKHR